MFKHCLYFRVVLSLVCCLGAAQAREVKYHAIDRSLRDVVDDLSASLGVRIHLLHGEELHARDWTVSGEAKDVIGSLTRDFDLFYVYDGHSYRLYPAADAAPHVMTMTGDAYKRLRLVVDEIFPSCSPQMLRFIPASHTLAVRAPDEIFAVIEQAVKAQKDAGGDTAAAGPDVIAAGVKRVGASARLSIDERP